MQGYDKFKMYRPIIGNTQLYYLVLTLFGVCIIVSELNENYCVKIWNLPVNSWHTLFALFVQCLDVKSGFY